MIWHLYRHESTLPWRGSAVKEILVISFPWGCLSALGPHSTLATHSDGGQQPFRHVGHNDANKKNNSLQPDVAQDKWEPKESDTEEDGHCCDQMDEGFDLHSHGGLAHCQVRGQRGNSAHHCGVSCGNHDAPGCPCGWRGKSELERLLGLFPTKRKLSTVKNKVETQGPLRGYNVLLSLQFAYASEGLLIWRISEEVSQFSRDTQFYCLIAFTVKKVFVTLSLNLFHCLYVSYFVLSSWRASPAPGIVVTLLLESCVPISPHPLTQGYSICRPHPQETFVKVWRHIWLSRLRLLLASSGQRAGILPGIVQLTGQPSSPATTKNSAAQLSAVSRLRNSALTEPLPCFAGWSQSAPCWVA